MTKVRRKVVKRVDSRAITLGWEKKEECEIKNMSASNGKKNNDNTNTAHRREPTFVWRMSRFSRQAKSVVGARPLKLGFSTHDNSGPFYCPKWRRPIVKHRFLGESSRWASPRVFTPHTIAFLASALTRSCQWVHMHCWLDVSASGVCMHVRHATCKARLKGVVGA
ncbi:hypothetical protein EJF18_20780 [Clavispora lusitaniae]|uniref:Uncharacterized protein n=2 Tax=Clavispora lusitaniae TaxID=36911 RepID=C4Y1A2_CLAL4|nr:uncharacterized protein CLUG_01984 [Clavispora lusitaniae ATCC 42720]QFZ26860.1 hypothetical protein EJF14_20780 [Clavispora lusitaniae]EEQ37861.1 predicted protein [Clavispora lusitaniae ATCC 42720]QFZ32528.1 hypothetical protein EJF16_20780 [Clavispora lusitaniae]QFZ38197.1 hypothetical protein EJF15_20780 [Clavispora lusitaniae]QFZ43880.1 hypothetical protein EJF18_20780 [Clavispora lusitaniae]